MNCGLIALVISTVVGIYIGILTLRPVSSLSDSMKCPFCYGIDLCKDIEDKRINLRFKSFRDFFFNLFSVKNLYFADYDGESVILKKLGHQSELSAIRTPPHLTKDIVLKSMNSADSGSLTSFKPCTPKVSETFLERVSSKFQLEHIWTILQVNVEPLILTIFQRGEWGVPKLYGTCGFLIVEKYCGLTLNHFETSPWHVRAYLAVQLLEAAINFTFKHNDFRLYLTDISPDNIAVDNNFTLYFIDLENVILKQKEEDNETIHYSEYFADENFIYNEEEVCQSSISDHNVYAVCRLLLSQTAPWPMMPKGLLHSPPSGVASVYTRLFALVEECVDSKLNRFYIAEELIRLLKESNRIN